MSADTDIALISGASTSTLKALNDHALTAMAAGRTRLAGQCIRMAERLTAENARLAAARAAKLAAGSLAGDIAGLSAVAAQAAAAKERLKSATAAIEAARRLISIIGRAAALVA